MSRRSILQPLRQLLRSPSLKQNRCSWCRKEFETAARLSEHEESTVRRASDDKRECTILYVCDWCHVGFGTLFGLSEHVRSTTRYSSPSGQECVPDPTDKSDDSSSFDELFGYSSKSRVNHVGQLAEENKPTFVTSGEGPGARTHMTRTFKTITEEDEKPITDHDDSALRVSNDSFPGIQAPAQHTVTQQLVAPVRSNATNSSSANSGRFISSASNRSFVTARTSSYASYRTAPSFSQRAPPVSTKAFLSANSPLTYFPIEKLHEFVTREQYKGHSNHQTTANDLDVLIQNIVFELEDADWCDEVPATTTIKFFFLDFCIRLLGYHKISVASIVAGAQISVISFCHLCNPRSKPAAKLDAFRGAISRLIMECLCDILKLRDLASDLENHLICTSSWSLRETRPQVSSSSWLEHLKSRGLILGPGCELDWSGQGQHVEYDQQSESAIPLTVERVLGYSASAIVESVMCRRIRLARKKIRCTRKLTRKDYIVEVEHLQLLQHAHILRVVGTYTFKKDLAILLYPVATWNLEEFMDEMLDTTSDINQDILTSGTWRHRSSARALQTFFGCLTHALAFIHDANVKHLDIKPKNLLVRARGGPETYKIYIADFGIARAYKSANDAETDSPVSFTRIYAPPEVVAQDTRGFSADIFSLGCVYLEMMATLISAPSHDQRQKLVEVRISSDEDSSYQANVERITTWFFETLPIELGHDEIAFVPSDLPNIVHTMLEQSPSGRPSAATLHQKLQHLCCSACDQGPEPFEAAMKEPS